MLTKNIFNLLVKLFHIILASHSEDMCTKYGRYRMKDAHTISPSDPVGLPTKVVWLTVFFSQKKMFFV